MDGGYPTQKKRKFTVRLLLFLVRHLGTLAYRLVCHSYRMRLVEWDRFDEYLVPGRAVAGVCWHQRLFYVPYFIRIHDMPPFHLLVSESPDGQMIAYVIEGLGIATVRGSTSRRAVSATSELRDLFVRQGVAGITPDGPRGPARKVQPGLVKLLAQTGTVVLPMAVSAESAWWTRGWDRFLFPKPLTRLVVMAGTPLLPPPPDSPDEELARFARRMEEELNAVTARADAEFGWAERRPDAALGLPVAAAPAEADVPAAGGVS